MKGMEVSALGPASGSMGTGKLICSAAGANTRFPGVAPGNDNACQSAVTNGPVYVANGDSKDVSQLYKGGVPTSTS